MKVLLFFLLIAPFSFGQTGLGAIKGLVQNVQGESIPFITVLVYASDDSARVLKSGAQADVDGRFQINSIMAGTYDLVIEGEIYGMNSVLLKRVEVLPERITFLDTIQMKDNGDQGPWIPEVPQPVRVISLDPFGRSITIPIEDIRRP